MMDSSNNCDIPNNCGISVIIFFSKIAPIYFTNLEIHIRIYLIKFDNNMKTFSTNYIYLIVLLVSFYISDATNLPGQQSKRYKNGRLQVQGICMLLRKKTIKLDFVLQSYYTYVSGIC